MRLQRIQKTLFFITFVIAIVVVIIYVFVTRSRQQSMNSLVATVMQTEQAVVDIPSGSSSEIVLSDGQIQVYEPGDFVILFPAEAVQRDYRVTMTSINPATLDPRDDLSWRHLIVVDVEISDRFDIPFEGLFFSVPLKVCFVLSDSQLAAYLEDENHFRIEHFNSEMSPAGWEVLPKVEDLTRRLICGQTSSLSLFALSEDISSLVPVTGNNLPRTSLISTATSLLIGTFMTPTNTPTINSFYLLNTPTNTLIAQNNPLNSPTSTPIKPKSTPFPPTHTITPTFTPTLFTNTPFSPTSTIILPTSTPLPPTNTTIPPSSTPIPATNTLAPPTNTAGPPTSTTIPPTSTPVPPTKTPKPTPERPTPKPTKV
jgi:hypothetical protein